MIDDILGATAPAGQQIADPINGCGIFSTGRWRTEALPYLEGIGPLLPGNSLKRPTVGKKWQEHPGFAVEQLQGMSALRFRCICWHIGADPDHVAVDIDGPSVIAALQARGCDPLTADTWRIQRSSTTDRLKVVFRVTPEQRAELEGLGKTTRIEGEELALFARHGLQVVVLGDHFLKDGLTHDDQYTWANTHPADAQRLPRAWLEALRALLGRDQPAAAPKAATTWSPPPGGAASDTAKALDALAFIPVAELSYNEWLRGGMALHSIGDPSLLGAWDSWSSGDPNRYKPGECEAKWAGFSPNGVGLGTLIEIAKRYGYQPPGRASVPREPCPQDGNTETAGATGEIDPDDLSDAAADRAAMAAEISSFRDLLNEPFSLQTIFPPGLAQCVTAAAAADGVPAVGYILPILAGVASVVGTRVRVTPNLDKAKSWSEPFVIYGANLAPPGAMKTPTSAPTIERPLIHWQIDLHKAHKAATDRWKAGLQHAEDRDKDERTGGCYVAEYLAVNPEPIGRELLVQDATIERIECFLQNPATFGIVAFNDELAGWFSAMCRNSGAGQTDRPKWLTFWTGGAVKVDRMGREQVLAMRCAVSVFGNLQPDRMAALRAADAKACDGIADGDGLWSRFLVVALPEQRWRFNAAGHDLTAVMENLYREAIDAKIPPLLDPEKKPFHPLAFAATAWPVMERFLHGLGDEGQTGTTERRQFLSKLRGYALRLAGLLHVIDRASRELPILGEINLATTEAACRLVAFFLLQHEQIHAGMAQDNAAALVKQLLSRGRAWRQEHGDTPVPLAQIRDWALPSRGATAKVRKAWLRQVVAELPNTGEVVVTGRSIAWKPPI